MGKGASSTSQSSTQNVDKSLTTESGEILALQDSTVNVSEGGSLTIVSRDPGAALAAVDAVREGNARIASVVSELTAGSNALAAEVAKTPVAVAELAAGQRQFNTALVVVGGIVAAVFLFKRK